MLARIKAMIKDKGFVLYTEPYQLNIVGIRSEQVKSNAFDDELHVFYRTPEGKWNYHVYPITTDPGTYWLNNPSYPQGTAILEQGQHRDAYAIGSHKGLYEALVQVKQVWVIRDYDRDAMLDFNNGTRYKGYFGINIHRAESKGTTKVINKYSAGCQVFQNADDFDEFMRLCHRHASVYGNSFTYTLVDFRAIRRQTAKRIIGYSSLVLAVIMGWLYKHVNN